MPPKDSNFKKFRAFLLNNIVTIVFLVVIVVGISASQNLSFSFFVNEVIARFFRNGFLVLSLIIPVMAGLGLNFGIVVGALAGILATLTVRYFEGGGVGGLLVCLALSLPLAILFGYLTGKLYNKTRGQEMIASLIVGYFASGIYQFIVLFCVGAIIPVAAVHTMVKPDGIGFVATFDMGMHPNNAMFLPGEDKAGLMYVVDWMWRIPFGWALIALGVGFLGYVLIKRLLAKRNPAIELLKPFALGMRIALCAAVVFTGVYTLLYPESLLGGVRQIPAATGLVIIALALFNNYFNRTKLGQDCRSVGQSQQIARVSGINVDKTRIIATIISTVLAAWGMIIYMQNMGTVSTYTAHMQIGMFSVASLLVGGASTTKAGVKNALIGVILFNAMFIVSPAIGMLVAPDNVNVGEFSRSFMVYGVIGVALGLYVWKAVKAARDKNRLVD